jgi:predicted outer membrane repeat protein
MIVSHEVRRHTRARRPALEPLEDRKLLATIIVDYRPDRLEPPAGGVSLRSAIARANTDHQADTIILTAGAYPTSGGYQIRADGPLKIEVVGRKGGKGGASITAAASSDSVFVVDKGAQVTLVDLSIAGGSGHPSINGQGMAGGGLFNLGETVLRNCVVLNNTATNGGGIYNGGELRIEGGSIESNTATTRGGGILNLSSSSSHKGPIALTIRKVLIQRNTAQIGGGLTNSLGSVEISGSTITGNSGGNLSAQPGSNGNVIVVDSVIG